ncbi:hypothetical protein PCAR4_570200 [Paraburkholderia caribensis]|nr:hypothetical protein PCAR4_570200 [Paraburkholderia caribensis]
MREQANAHVCNLTENACSLHPAIAAQWQWVEQAYFAVGEFDDLSSIPANDNVCRHW